MLNQKFNSLYGTVTIEDKGHNDHWYAIVDSDGSRVHGTIGENGFLIELVPEPVKPRPWTPAPPPNSPEYKDVFEWECGGPDAAGGGCGAPVGAGITRAGKEEFEKCQGKALFDFSTYNDDEVRYIDESLLDSRDKGLLRVKTKYRPCGGCGVL